MREIKRCFISVLFQRCGHHIAPSPYVTVQHVPLPAGEQLGSGSESPGLKSITVMGSTHPAQWISASRA